LLSALTPVFTLRTDSVELSVEVKNFGQVASPEATLQLTVEKNGEKINIGKTTIPALKPHEKTNVRLVAKPLFEKGTEYAFTSTILSKDNTLEIYNFKTIVIAK
jgi:uncharacterized membrane protein